MWWFFVCVELHFRSIFFNVKYVLLSVIQRIFAKTSLYECRYGNYSYNLVCLCVVFLKLDRRTHCSHGCSKWIITLHYTAPVNFSKGCYMRVPFYLREGRRHWRRFKMWLLCNCVIISFSVLVPHRSNSVVVAKRRSDYSLVWSAIHTW
jgi:hypothetical protein